MTVIAMKHNARIFLSSEKLVYVPFDLEDLAVLMSQFPDEYESREVSLPAVLENLRRAKVLLQDTSATDRLLWTDGTEAQNKEER